MHDSQPFWKMDKGNGARPGAPTERPSRLNARARRLFPLLLLSTMVGIALIVEPLRFHEILWLPKLPLILLLGSVWFRRRDE